MPLSTRIYKRTHVFLSIPFSPDPDMNIGIMLTEFPNQTSISMWRVGNALRQQGHTVKILSTRHSRREDVCHSALQDDVNSALYAWPPRFVETCLGLLKNLGGLLRALRYIFSLEQANAREKLMLLPMMASAIRIVEFSKSNQIEHILVHSLANGAHLINLARLFGGPPFSLRLGGDLEAYGKDHRAKFANAAFTLPASLNNRDQILEHNLIPANKILTTWLGVDTEKFAPLPGKTPTRQLKLVTVARLNPAKGHIYALQALLEILQEQPKVGFHYTIAGAGPSESTLKQFVHENQMSEHVSFTGQVDESQAIQLLQESDIFLLNSVGIGEASPVSLIEAMACGLACISSVIGGTPQIITDRIDGILLEQKNVDALKKTILELSTNSDFRQSLSDNARKSAVEYFSCAQVATAFTQSIDAISKDPTADLEGYSPIIRKLNSGA